MHSRNVVCFRRRMPRQQRRYVAAPNSRTIVRVCRRTSLVVISPRIIGPSARLSCLTETDVRSPLSIPAGIKGESSTSGSTVRIFSASLFDRSFRFASARMNRYARHRFPRAPAQIIARPGPAHAGRPQPAIAAGRATVETSPSRWEYGPPPRSPCKRVPPSRAARMPRETRPAAPGPLR